MSHKAIRVEKVSKSVKSRRDPAREILQDISLEVGKGEVFGLLGLEGAGKTSLLKILAGFHRPTQGRAEVLGVSTPSLHRVRDRVGYVSESKGLYEYMRVQEIVRFCKSLSPRWDDEKVWQLLKEVPVSPLARVGSLSRSQQGFLYLALTLAARPEVLLLDEPAETLDDVGKGLFTKQLLEYMDTPGRTVLATSKNILDIAGIVDRMAILKGGKMAFCGGPGSMQESFCKVRIVPRGRADFHGIPGVYRVEREHRSYLIKIMNNKPRALELLKRIPNDFFDIIPMNIRDTYLELAKEGNDHG